MTPGEHSADAPLAVALIGAGRMARTHANVLADVGFVRIARVCDAVPDAAAALAARFGAGADSDLDAVLGDPAIDAVIITTPTGSHAEMITRAAEAGKHIFVEKPVAADLAGAARAVAAVAAAGVQCQVGFQRRYDPAYQEAKRLIDAGELGRTEGFRGVSRDPFPPALEYLKTSGGLMIDLGIHDLDSARFFVGEVDEVYCVGSVQVDARLVEFRLFDTAVATLRFANGALGTIENGLRTTYGYDVRAEVLGEKGRLHLEMDARYHLRHYDERGVSYDRPRNFEQRFSDAYAAEIRAFADNLRAGRPVTPTAADAGESLRLALAAQTSLETGRIVSVRDFGRESAA